jgi:hypothetical protein
VRWGKAMLEGSKIRLGLETAPHSRRNNDLAGTKKKFGSNPVHLNKEHNIIEASSVAMFAGQGPGIASNIYLFSTTFFSVIQNSEDHIKEKTIPILEDKQKQHQR